MRSRVLNPMRSRVINQISFFLRLGKGIWMIFLLIAYAGFSRSDDFYLELVAFLLILFLYYWELTKNARIK